MSKLVPTNENLIVEIYDKIKKRSEGSPFSSVVSSQNLGVVRHSSNPDYPVGTRIYFRVSNSERLLMNGTEVLAIYTKDVIAKDLDSENDESK